MKNHYTYYSYEEWGKGYIGRRSCECLPEEDTEYFGSFSDPTFNPTKKIILRSDYKTCKESVEDEVFLHDFYEVDTNPHFANKSRQRSTGFSFSAAGKDNPNFGGGRMPASSRDSISRKKLSEES